MMAGDIANVFVFLLVFTCFELAKSIIEGRI